MHAYIDLGYAERLFRDFAEAVFPDEALHLDLERIWYLGHVTPSKVFVYDSEPEQRSMAKKESEEEYSARLASHDDRLKAIELLPRVFLRCGRLVERVGRRMPRREQKRVDVNIACDMLAHAMRGLMRSVYFVAGDDDYTPLLRAMMDTPCTVTLACDTRNAYHDLQAAASEVASLGPATLIRWAAEEVHGQRGDRLWRANRNDRSRSDGRTVKLYDAGEGRFLTVSTHRGVDSAGWVADSSEGFASRSESAVLRALCFSIGVSPKSLREVL